MKASKQALLDAKAKVKSEWVIVKELRNRRSNMAQMEVEIARLTKERDEARREAYRQWLMRACDLEHEYGIRSEYNRLESLYIFQFTHRA